MTQPQELLATDLSGLRFTESEAGRTETVIEICRDGEWKHPVYGEIHVTSELRESFARNFAGNVRKADELPIDYDHHDGPAAAWICGLRNEGPSLYADVWLTPAGAERVRSGEYRKFSPEWHPNWIDPETGKEHGPTLFGGAFTNKPFFRSLASLRCSETGEEIEGRDSSLILPSSSFAELRFGKGPKRRLIRILWADCSLAAVAEPRSGVAVGVGIVFPHFTFFWLTP